MIQDGQLLNYIRGTWKRSRASEYLDVRNPETAETMVRVPLTPAEEVDEAVQAVRAAFPDCHGFLPVLWLERELCTEKKIVVERWPKEWSRKF